MGGRGGGNVRCTRGGVGVPVALTGVLVSCSGVGQSLAGAALQADLEAHLPERYLTSLPEHPGLHDPVKELNTGSLARSSPCFGIHRVSIGDDQKQLVRAGDFVEYICGGEDSGPHLGRVCATYVDLLRARLAVSLQRVVSASWLERVAREGLTPGGHHQREPQEAVWLTNLVHERVPVDCITRLVQFACPEPDCEDIPWIAGEAKLDGGDVVSRVSWSCIPPWVPAPDPVALNPDHLPVANMSLAVWGDKFQTFRRRVHSTTMYATTYASLPFELRNSHAFIRVISCTPPEVCELTAFRTIFGCLRRLEEGLSLPCKDPGLAPEGRVFVRAGLQASLADSPFQAKKAYGMGPTSNTPCPLDYLGIESNPYSDQVGEVGGL